jgi:hypothetical protein
MIRPMLAAAVVGLTAAVATAAPLVSYSFSGTGGSSASYLAPTSTAGGLTASSISGGPNMPLAGTVMAGVNNQSGVIGPDGPGNNQPPHAVRGNPVPSLLLAQNDMTTGPNQTPAQRLANALTQGNFVSFTLTPSGGGGLNLDAISFDLAAFHLGADDAADMRVYLFSSVGGFGTPAAAVGALDLSVFGTETPLLPHAFTLGSPFDAVNGPVEFRLYFTSDRGRAQNYILLDNLNVGGQAVPTPEPASVVLFAAVVGIGVGVWRRKRRG